jgi:hypothetical protein
MWKAQCEQQAKDLTRINADYNAAIDLAELAEAETDGLRAATDEAFAWANKTVREHEAALALTTSAAIKAEDERDAALAEVARLRDALDKIFSLIAYVNIHGVGAQPEPSGEPQVMRVPPDEFHRIWTEIGDTARVALEAKS